MISIEYKSRDMSMILENMVFGVKYRVEIGCELASVDDVKRDITELKRLAGSIAKRHQQPHAPRRAPVMPMLFAFLFFIDALRFYNNHSFVSYGPHRTAICGCKWSGSLSKPSSH